MLKALDSPAKNYSSGEDLPVKKTVSVPPYSRGVYLKDKAVALGKAQAASAPGKAVASGVAVKKVRKSGVKPNTEIGEDALTSDCLPDFDMRDTMNGSLDKSKQGRDALQEKNASDIRGGEKKRRGDSDIDENANLEGDVSHTADRVAEARSRDDPQPHLSSSRSRGRDKDRRRDRSHSESRGRDKDRRRDRSHSLSSGRDSGSKRYRRHRATYCSPEQSSRQLRSHTR